MNTDTNRTAMTAEKFRKKPVVIEAIKWTGDNAIQIMDFVGRKLEVSKHPARHIEGIPATIIIPTLEGQHIATEGDWIIKGVKGECYPCKPDIFEQTYEAASQKPSQIAEDWEKEFREYPDKYRLTHSGWPTIDDCIDWIKTNLLSSLQYTPSQIDNDEAQRLAIEFADSRERRGCSHWWGLAEGYKAALSLLKHGKDLGADSSTTI